MKVFKPIGSKERFVEMVKLVNKIHLNEDISVDDYVINILNKLNDGSLKVNKVNTQTNDYVNFLEIIASDGQNNYLMKFEVETSEDGIDDVFEINSAKLIEFKVNDSTTYNENNLTNTNYSYSKEILELVKNYVDVDSNVSQYADKLAEAINVIDSISLNYNSDVLHGGLGDDKNVNDFDPKQIELGLEVEKEHTSNPSIALEIVMDHLSENPNYYTTKDNPEDSAQANASQEAGDSDKEVTDALLGYKPLNVGDNLNDNKI